MSLWLSIPLAVAFSLNALIQIRMAMIYSGMIDSPATGFYKGQGSNPWLRLVAIRSAVTSVAYVIVVFLTGWPQLLTYIAGVWVCRAVIDIIFFPFDLSIYWHEDGIAPLMPTKEERRALIAGQFKKALFMLTFNGFLLSICFFFLRLQVARFGLWGPGPGGPLGGGSSWPPP